MFQSQRAEASIESSDSIRGETSSSLSLVLNHGGNDPQALIPHKKKSPAGCESSDVQSQRKQHKQALIRLPGNFKLRLIQPLGVVACTTVAIGETLSIGYCSTGCSLAVVGAC